MTEKDQIHTLLADLAGEDPPVDIDLDRQIHLGRRRTRHRTIALCVTAVAVPAVLLGGVLTLGPDGDAIGPSAGPGTPSLKPPTPSKLPTAAVRDLAPWVQWDNPGRSTEKSRALGAELEQLVPEIRAIKGARSFDRQPSVKGQPVEFLAAGVDLTIPDVKTVTLSLEVGAKANMVPQCEGRTGVNACTEIRKLPGGVTAYLKKYSIPDTKVQGVGVTLDRPDGTRVNFWNGTMSKDGKLPTPLDLARVLEVAQQVTVRP